jgi:hypothetical protein
MQKGDMAEKIRLYVSGDEIPGLVNFGEIVVERGVIEVPEFKRIRNIQNGIEKLPVIECTFKVARDSKTLKLLRDWYYNDEVKDITKVRTDAHGVEFSRTLLPGCECIKYQEPQFDGANPTYAQVQTKFVPWDVIPVES